MGTSTIFDIISSTVVAGLLLLMALRLNDQASETTRVYNTNLSLQQNMTALVTILEHDFRRIGYCQDYTKIPQPTLAIRKADSSEIMFWTDVNNDGALDSIRYYLGSPSELDWTPNPLDRKLYRVINNNTTAGWNLGVTQFTLNYRDYAGDVISVPVANPQEIYSVEISVAIQNPGHFTTEYRTSATSSADFEVSWRQLRLSARNLRNR